MAELKLVKMSNITPEPVDWLWEPYVAFGAITLIQGDGGLGKSTMSLAIATALTRGEALPSGSTPIPLNVIIQNGEDSYNHTVRPRLEQLGADCELIHFIDEEDKALSFADERIEQALIATNAKLLIFDPTQAYFGRANMNSANGVRPLLKKLGKVASRHGCAVILLGHLNKQGGKSQYAGLGSIDIYATARSVLTVGKISKDDEDEIRAAFVHSKCNIAPLGKPQAYTIDRIKGFAWAGECDVTLDEVLGKGKRPESQFSKARKLIEMALAHEPVLSVDMLQMAEEQGISAKTLNRAKDALGVVSVKRGNCWFWILPIETTCTDEPQGSQHGQDGQLITIDEVGQVCHDENMTSLANLTILPETTSQNLSENIAEVL